MKDSILDLVSRWQHVTFANLDAEILGFRGDYAMSASGNPHLILWHAVSEEGVEALKELLATKRIYMHPAQVLSYFIDGLVPRIPVSKSARIYKRDHWAPVCF